MEGKMGTVRYSKAKEGRRERKRGEGRERERGESRMVET